MAHEKKGRSSEVPALAESLCNGIRITAAQREKFVILPSEDTMNPPPYTAELTTYSIELLCKNPPTNPKERETFRHKIERILLLVDTEEAFYRYYKGLGVSTEPHQVDIDWNATPPVATISGTFTYDALCGLINKNLLEPNLAVAHLFEKASAGEYRSPLMFSDVEYKNPEVDEYQRSKMIPNHEDSIGDMGAVAPEQQYAHAVMSLQQGLARGHITDKDHFMRATGFIAVSTLMGLLPSPYATEQKLLGEGSESADKEAKRRVFEQRIRDVVGDVVGEGAELLWDDAAAKADSPDGIERITLAELQEKIRGENKARKGMPEWATGTKAEYERSYRIREAKGREKFLEMNSPSEQASGFAAVDALKYYSDQLPVEAVERFRELKEKWRPKISKNTALSTPRSTELATMDLSWPELNFFGVHHSLKCEKYSEPFFIEYTSRNPRWDPPRALPRSLQLLLDRERDANEKAPAKHR